jgi:hypothetical protein
VNYYTCCGKPLKNKRVYVIVDSDSRPEHTHIVQKHSTGQGLKGRGYDLTDFMLDCFQKMTAVIERRQE